MLQMNKNKEKKNKYWWDPNCARATAQRKKAQKDMLRHPSTQNILTYKRLTAVAIKIHKLAKRLAWRRYISKITNQTSSKEIWNIIRSFKGLRKVKNSPLLLNNIEIHDVEEKANVFARS